MPTCPAISLASSPKDILFLGPNEVAGRTVAERVGKTPNERDWPYFARLTHDDGRGGRQLVAAAEFRRLQPSAMNVGVAAQVEQSRNSTAVEHGSDRAIAPGPPNAVAEHDADVVPTIADQYIANAVAACVRVER